MKLPSRAQLLRIFLNERSKHKGRPLYEVIVEAAQQHGLAGATVLRGLLGYGGKSGRIRTMKILRLSENMPMVVEIVDDSAKIDSFLPLLDDLIEEGMVTVQETNVITYRVDNHAQR